MLPLVLSTLVTSEYRISEIVKTVSLTLLGLTLESRDNRQWQNFQAHMNTSKGWIPLMLDP